MKSHFVMSKCLKLTDSGDQSRVQGKPHTQIPGYSSNIPWWSPLPNPG